MQLALIGNPENRRVAFFQEALTRRDLPPARVVSWLDLLQGRATLSSLLEEADLLRIESPGESFAVERELIARGADEPDDFLASTDRIDAAAARALEDDKGRVRHSRQWFLGFRQVLQEISAALGSVGAMNAPDAIACMFDKVACQQRFAEAGVPTPRVLPPVQTWDELRAAMREAGLLRVFVKLAHASSASGVLALTAHPDGDRHMAYTTVELVREVGEVRLYNSLRIRRYSRADDLATIIDTLGRDRIHVEEWVPKARFEGKACDLRLVVIGGRGRHAVLRQSQSPLTNLHLGNERGDLAGFQATLGEERWASLVALGERAAAAFPDALYAGVDLLVGRGLSRQVVLEANAFGDLLPRVEHEGRDTYLAEVDAALEHAA